MLDLKITNAMIVDGTGRPAYFGDVGVEGGRLRAIGDVWDGAAEVIDADGRVVAPGFIDLHTHYDAQLRWDPVTPSCWHGVTTAIVGNCGYGVAPCRPADRRSLAELLARAEGMSLAALDPDGWSSITQAEYLRTLAGPGQLGINVGSLVPHSAVRTFVMGEAALERAATAEEIAAMKQLVADGMRAGAFGFSSSQVREHFGPGGRPVPSRQATLGEIKALAQAAAGFGGLFEYTGTGRDDREPDLLEHIRLLKGIAEDIGRPALLAVVLQSWMAPSLWRESLALVEESNTRAGARVFPWISTNRFDVPLWLKTARIPAGMPCWARLVAADPGRAWALTGQPAFRRGLHEEAAAHPLFLGGPLADIRIARVACASNRAVEGRRLPDVARQRGLDLVDALLEVVISDQLDTELTMMGALNGQDGAVDEMLQHPQTLVGLSDAGAHTETQAHYGYTTRLLGRYVRERGALALEDAVHKLTAVPAGLLQLGDRGVLATGRMADLVIFDPALVGPGEPEWLADMPGAERRLVTRPTGVFQVIVNGSPVLSEGQPTGARPGRLLRGRDHQQTSH